MPITNNKKVANQMTTPSVSTVHVHRKAKAVNIPLLTADLVPPGKYRSKILSVEDAVCANGAPAADVVYRFSSDCGTSAEAKVRYPLSGYHIGQLFEALLDAGLPEGSPLVDGVGIEEVVEIVYPFEGALGKIKTRRPAESPAPSTPKAKSKHSSRPRPFANPDLLAEDPEEDSEDEFEDFADFDDDE